MTVATVLVLYAACVGTLGSRMLGRAMWPGRAPLLLVEPESDMISPFDCVAAGHGNRRNRLQVLANNIRVVPDKRAQRALIRDP